METDLYKKTVIQNLRRIREQKGLSTTQLAEILGVSQAKVSYIENGKGVLSAADVATLSRRLGVPVAEFFSGLDEIDASGSKEIIHQLVRFGATLLAKPKGITKSSPPFEEVFVKALSFLDDPRLHHAFHAALIEQAATQVIHFDRVFSQIGSNPFLLNRSLQELRIALEVLRIYPNVAKDKIPPRAKTQLQFFAEKARETLASANWNAEEEKARIEEAEPIAEFVAECRNA